MNFLLKNSETLTLLFSHFTLQEMVQVNQNLNATWHFLSLPPERILTAMNDKNVNIEDFLGKKCLPLIRFYLCDEAIQKETFLSSESLEKLFISLPAVEAVVFKLQINRAQHSLQQANQTLSSLLISDPLILNDSLAIDKQSSVVQLNRHQQTSNSALNLELEKNYVNCFYYLQSGELFIVDEDETRGEEMLLYRELSPLQQLKAQALSKALSKLSREVSPDNVPQQSVSA